MRSRKCRDAENVVEKERIRWEFVDGLTNVLASICTTSEEIGGDDLSGCNLTWMVCHTVSHRNRMRLLKSG